MIPSLVALALASTSPAATGSTVTERSVAAHEAFLASDALQGRGSATRDEAIAAAYVASQFQSYGLTPPPGMTGYLQTATIVKQKLSGPILLTADGGPVTQATLLTGAGKAITGPLAAVEDPKDLPSAPIVLLTANSFDAMQLFRAARDKHVALLLIRESDATRKLATMIRAPRLPAYLEGETPPDQPAIVTVPDAAVDALAGKPGVAVTLTVPTAADKSQTTNAIGYLKGSDPKAGTLLFSAHLDHLGVRPDGTIMHGANDDASGTTAVLELAKALSSGKRPKRSILFVAYGSEEIGEYGSTYFGEHPPIPLNQIVANVEFEMIGAQDPKLPKNTLMMTGFERSDNYTLALKGIVAHTVSGWAVTPTYHQPTDTYENLNIPFMTMAIRSLVAPLEWLANSNFVPAWKPGGQPSKN